jgi:ATP-dependent Clp protease adaptor protein ClpS
VATTETQTRPQTRDQPDTEEPRQWNVVLIDDQHHTYEYVVRMMQELFAHTLERAFLVACRVDAEGRAVCLTTHKEHAELKRDQILAYGPDRLMAESAGSMTAVIEPAEFEGDEDDGAPGS